MIQELLQDARSYCTAAGIKLETLGQYAVRDNTLFRRLETGGQCLPRTADRVRAYIKANPPRPRSRRSEGLAIPRTGDAA